MSILHSQVQGDHRGLHISLMQVEQEEDGQDSHVPPATMDAWEEVPAFAWLPLLHPPPPRLVSTFELFLHFLPPLAPWKRMKAAEKVFSTRDTP